MIFQVRTKISRIEKIPEFGRKMGWSTLIRSPANVYRPIPFKFEGVAKHTYLFWNFENLMWIFSILVFFMTKTVSTQDWKLWLFTAQKKTKYNKCVQVIPKENGKSQVKPNKAFHLVFTDQNISTIFHLVDIASIMKKTKIEKIHLRFSKFLFLWVFLTALQFLKESDERRLRQSGSKLTIPFSARIRRFFQFWRFWS